MFYCFLKVRLSTETAMNSPQNTPKRQWDFVHVLEIARIMVFCTHLMLPSLEKTCVCMFFQERVQYLQLKARCNVKLPSMQNMKLQHYLKDTSLK